MYKFLKTIVKKERPLENEIKTIKSEHTELLNKVLIVDDADINRYILKKYLQKLNYKIDIIDETFNGYEAIKMCDNNNYNIIFLDLKMPGIDGIETAIQILKKNPDNIIIACTGQVESDVISKCKKIGIIKCIGKPISLNDLTFIEQYL